MLTSLAVDFLRSPVKIHPGATRVSIELEDEDRVDGMLTTHGHSGDMRASDQAVAGKRIIVGWSEDIGVSLLRWLGSATGEWCDECVRARSCL